MNVKERSQLAEDLTIAIVESKSATIGSGGVFTVRSLRSTVLAFITINGLTMPTKGRKSPSVQGNARFTPPTPAEVAEYGVSIDYALNGDDFCDSYEAKGWLVGKVKMKNWQAAVRNWKRNGWGKLTTPPKDDNNPTDYTKL